MTGEGEGLLWIFRYKIEFRIMGSVIHSQKEFLTVKGPAIIRCHWEPSSLLQQAVIATNLEENKILCRH
jgi:hypothetical protein